ncbi:MAG TPA: hypothetical protein VJN18_21790 [Polyangiaceae bacterium]|nr:hypothetical protein [Polyangiaceae bacterium]
MKVGQFVPACGLLATLATPAAAQVQEPTPAARRLHAPLPGSDGVYGRFDGSLQLSLSAGAELEATDPRAALRLAGHYLWTAGAYFRYSDAFGAEGERPARALSFGVDVRPLFLPRFALDAEQGPALLDLTLDSLSLTSGAYFAQPRGGSFGGERGFELGLGLGVPLLAEAAGPWLELRGERRFADEAENAWLFSAFLSWHALIWTTEPQ